jgi:hypothetical protein
MAIELDWIDCWFYRILLERIRPFINARFGLPSDGIKLPVRGVYASFSYTDPSVSKFSTSADAFEKSSLSLYFWLIGLPCPGDFYLAVLGESEFLNIIVLYNFVLRRGCWLVFRFLRYNKVLLIWAKLDVVERRAALESTRTGFWSFSLENWFAAAVIGCGTSEYMILDLLNTSSLYIADCLLY